MILLIVLEIIASVAAENCLDPESDPGTELIYQNQLSKALDYLLCEAHFQEAYVQCILDCANDSVCIQQCARVYAENLQRCPCQE